MKKQFFKPNQVVAKLLLFLAFFATISVFGRTYHVAVDGNNKNPGTEAKPLKTIQAAANLAQPGDVIRVHEGTYREQVNPPRGGTSDNARIVYEAAPGEKVFIKGSEIIKGWKKIDGDQWQVTLDNKSTFGNFNPHDDLIKGDWVIKNVNQHTGMIYIDGVQMVQADTQAEYDNPGKNLYFIAEVNDKSTILKGWFKGVDPNKATIEINVRKSCFFPTKEHIDYLTIRGFDFSQTATPWAPPSALQIAMVTAHWCKGWIIEDNIIHDSRNSGIALGKFGDATDNTKGTKAGGDYHNEVVLRAISYGWTKEKIGHHMVRNNRIFNCAQAGIIGAHGGAFSTVTRNEIFDCGKGRWQGAEKAGIKLHMAVDAVISYNHIYRCAGSGGMWLDWLQQGTIVKGNLMHDNGSDLNLEVSHGPTAIFNNFFISGSRAIKDWSDGAAYCHNLIVGEFPTNTQGRSTPFLAPHSLSGHTLAKIPDGDDRMYNNLFVNTSMAVYDIHTPMWMIGNVYVGKSTASKLDEKLIVNIAFNPDIKVTQAEDGWYLEMTVDGSWNNTVSRPIVTTALLGKPMSVNQSFEKADGTPLSIDYDYFGTTRNRNNPSAGPIEIKEKGIHRIKVKVWPLKEGI